MKCELRLDLTQDYRQAMFCCKYGRICQIIFGQL